MRRLHSRLYLAVVATLVAFCLCAAMAWHFFATPLSAVWGVESAVGFAGSLLQDESDPAVRQQLAERLADQLHADVALFSSSGAVELNVGKDPLVLSDYDLTRPGWHVTSAGHLYTLILDDGEFLAVHPHHRLLLHGLHMGLMLMCIALTLALVTYPITRSITARLARLEAGVRQFGQGNLAARVAVEGRDEVATLARSFNDSAARVEQLVRAHNLLLANCSHELRTPLTRLRLAIEALPDPVRAANEELTRNIGELDALIGEMLLSSRLEATGGTERREPVDLLALVAEEAAYFDREVTGDSVTLDANPVLLRRLVRNLLENARAHAGGATAVRVESDPARVRVMVEDSGPGIPEAERERIFEPFHRLPREARDRLGSGLGLAIVRQIARAHGGDVGVESGEGGGSRFVVTLPRQVEARVGIEPA